MYKSIKYTLSCKMYTFCSANSKWFVNFLPVSLCIKLHDSKMLFTQYTYTAMIIFLIQNFSIAYIERQCNNIRS